MLKPERPANEDARLQALKDFAILDTPPETAFDDLVHVAATLCGTEMATVNLLDADRGWFKARTGIDVESTPRDFSFCAHAILDPVHVMEIPDTFDDVRTQGNPLAEEGGIRFYAGAPLLDDAGHALGTLCVFGREPKHLSAPQLDGLRALSRQASQLLRLRRLTQAMSRQMAERDWYEQQLQGYQSQLETENAELVEQTRTDPLTGLNNRRAFGRAVEQAIARAVEHAGHVAVAVLDIDHFKTINDVHGHAEGDAVLVELASLLRDTGGGRGMAARYGGEEFVLLFPETTAEQARLQCEFLRERVSTLPMGLPVTVSIGVAEMRLRDDTAEALIKRADDALYAAKRAGRDRVVVAA